LSTIPKATGHSICDFKKYLLIVNSITFKKGNLHNTVINEPGPPADTDFPDAMIKKS